MEPGVVPLDGLTASQAPPEVVAALVVKLTAVEPAAIRTAWLAGVLPPVVNEKESEVGLAVNGGVVPTVRVTGMVTVLEPEAVTVTVPV
jgi:hypothetical protein